MTVASNSTDMLRRLYEKLVKKLQALKRRKCVISTHAKKRIYMAYFVPRLTRCLIVWIHCRKRNADKLEKLNESILRFVFNDHNSSSEKLLGNINKPSLLLRLV